MVTRFDWLYGVGWGVGFARGANIELVNTVMFLFLVPICWVFWELFKGRDRS